MSDRDSSQQRQGRALGALEVPTLSERDRELLGRLLGNPLEYPAAFREWLPRYLEANPPVFTKEAVPDSLQAIPGMGTVWPFAAAPEGYVFANGQVLSRDDAEDLFRLIGTTFNTGGETGDQFRVPNIPNPATNVRWILKL